MPETQVGPEKEERQTSCNWWEIRRAHPALFGKRFRPMKIGIFADLMQAHEGRLSRSCVQKFLLVHTASTGYQLALLAGGPRYALDGSCVGEVTDEERQSARDRLESLKAKDEKRHADIARRSHTLKAFEASGLDRRGYAEKSNMTLDELCPILDKAVAERLVRRRKRLRIVEKLERSGLTTEEFAAREKMPMNKLERIIAKVRQAVV